MIAAIILVIVLGCLVSPDVRQDEQKPSID